MHQKRHYSALRVNFNIMRDIYSRFTHLFTYLLTVAIAELQRWVLKSCRPTLSALDVIDCTGVTTYLSTWIHGSLVAHSVGSSKLFAISFGQLQKSLLFLSKVVLER